MKKRIISILLLGALVVCTACSGNKQQKSNHTELIESASDTPTLIEVSYADIEDASYYFGVVSPFVDNLRFPKAGNFLEFQVEMGEQVTEGQILATMENPYEERIKSLKKQIRNLEITYDNTVTNYDLSIRNNNWITSEKKERMLNSNASMPGFDELCIDFEMQMAETGRLKLQKNHYIEETELELNYLKATLESLENKVNTNVIKAPYSGKIVYLADIKVGDYLEKNFAAMAIADTTHSYVMISDDWTESQAKEYAYIYALSAELSEELTYHKWDEDVLIKRKNNNETVFTYFDVGGNQLKAGDSVVVVAVKDNRKSVLSVPTLCIYRDGGKCFVNKYVDGEKQAVEVEIGLADKFNTEILTGLEKGDLVYGAN